MPAELVVVKGKDRGAYLPLKKQGIHTIGRSDGSDLALRADKKVSTSHARITGMGDERYVLEDLNSTNGTFVNGERISQVPLRSGDRVKIGHTLLIFRTDTASVHISDLDVDRPKSSAGGSSSAAGKDGVSASASSILPEVRFGNALGAIADVLGAPGALRDQLSAALREVVSATKAGRAILFLRDPDGGALGVAGALGREDVAENAPIDSAVLRKAALGELAAPSGELSAAAAPVRFQETILGALYVDAPGGRSPLPGEGRFLVAAASITALALRAERLGRFAASAVEVVSLAQNPPSRRPVELSSLAEAAVRLYAPVAASRGLTLDVEVPSGLFVSGDEALLTRVLDRLVETALVAAKGGLRVSAEPSETTVRLVVTRGGPPLAEGLAAELVSLEGPATDLTKALARGSDGALALARAAVARSGGRLAVEPATPGARYVLELPPASES
jgi:signal transduction histidine kinase